jgi:hypothetical protein
MLPPGKTPPLFRPNRSFAALSSSNSKGCTKKNALMRAHFYPLDAPIPSGLHGEIADTQLFSSSMAKWKIADGKLENCRHPTFLGKLRSLGDHD